MSPVSESSCGGGKAQNWSVRMLIDTVGRAFPTEGGEPVKRYHQMIPRHLELHAKMVGNLGAIESFMPEDPVAQLCTLMNVTRAELAEIVGYVRAGARLEEREKVIPCLPPQNSK